MALDPEGDTAPEVVEARAEARRELGREQGDGKR
jgi:hypothetical protein